ncbi:hypothetical protein [Phycisphaera mikurensis]|nr:hypothetical protein [Phycisphaera mikurensis]MBB6442150.1 hypothetical protein [Phycisphaera mikurensis]
MPHATEAPTARPPADRGGYTPPAATVRGPAAQHDAADPGGAAA